MSAPCPFPQAPEQFHGKVSEKSDIFAVGLILWECWTLQRPWSATDERDLWGIVYEILNDNKRPEIPDGCPKSLRSLLQDCWEMEPGLRPTALQLKERLWKIMTVHSRRRPPGPGEEQTPSPSNQQRQRQLSAAPDDLPKAVLVFPGSSSLRTPEPYRIATPEHEAGRHSSSTADAIVEGSC